MIRAKVAQVHLVHVTRELTNIVQDLFAVHIGGLNGVVSSVTYPFLALSTQKFNLADLGVVYKSKSLTQLVLVHSLSFHINEGIW